MDTAASCRPPEDEALAEQAESVRAYLVAVRGGAPFLSSADGRLLLGWLEQRVPVPLILSAIDDAAERRQKKRARTRLTLRGCRARVEKRWGAAPAPLPRADVEPLRQWVADVASSESGVVSLVTAAEARIDEGGALESLVSDLVDACRRFHEAAWRGLTEDARVAHRDAAVVDLATLRDHVKPAVWDDLVEEAARARLRSRWPLVCASAVWDRVASG